DETVRQPVDEHVDADEEGRDAGDRTEDERRGEVVDGLADRRYGTDRGRLVGGLRPARCPAEHGVDGQEPCGDGGDDDPGAAGAAAMAAALRARSSAASGPAGARAALRNISDWAAACSTGSAVPSPGCSPGAAAAARNAEAWA